MREAKGGGEKTEEKAERRKGAEVHAGENDEGKGRDFVGRSSTVKAAAKGLKTRSRIAFLKITGTGKLTAGQLPGRKSLRKFLLPRDRTALP